MEDQNKNKKVTPMQCDECKIFFSTKSNLQRHIAGMHKNDKPYKCEYCDFKCGQASNLKKHKCYILKASSHSLENGPILSSYSIEYNIQTKLELELKGTKVVCDYGRVDLMTKDTIIEIKKWDEHKKAIGQILGYSVYFPLYKKRIHFFGQRPSDKVVKAIEEVCKHYKILITSE